MLKHNFKRYAPVLLGGLLLIGLPSTTPPTAEAQQDPTFRLMNLERRADQLQQRLDFVERTQQNQTLNAGNTTNYNAELLLEIQRQQLSLAQQVIHLQQRMLEMQKTIDRLAERTAETPKADKPTEKPKVAVPAKPASRKP